MSVTQAINLVLNQAANGRVDLVSPRFGVLICSVCGNPRATTIVQCPECCGRGSGRTHAQITEAIADNLHNGVVYMVLTRRHAEQLNRQWARQNIKFISLDMGLSELEKHIRGRPKAHFVADHALPLDTTVSFWRRNNPAKPL